MNQLGDLEKILSAAKEIGENFQKELSQAREENELLKIEIEELHEEIKTLREENEKIYLEMHDLRAAKEDVKVANEAFSNNLNHLVTQLEDNHAKTMTQINQLLTGGLQNFVVEYMKKFTPPAEGVPVENQEKTAVVETLENDDEAEIIVENTETAVATKDDAKKNRMQYAAFYAEEAALEKEDAAESVKIKKISTPHK